MALTNAERQARHRKRNRAKIDAAANSGVTIERLQAKLDELNEKNGTSSTLADFEIYWSDCNAAHYLNQHISENNNETLEELEQFLVNSVVAMIASPDPWPELTRDALDRLIGYPFAGRKYKHEPPVHIHDLIRARDADVEVSLSEKTLMLRHHAEYEAWIAKELEAIWREHKSGKLAAEYWIGVKHLYTDWLAEKEAQEQARIEKKLAREKKALTKLYDGNEYFGQF